ncbi:Glycosyltransferase family 9 (heptosyltransferase) [uncultured archaeon]|nr:Glycosyltransferase family 9 (heptosyltransferase) [uncultured archaeon]
MKVGIMSCPGLGDGLISLLLAENLSQSGNEVEVFHAGVLCELKKWFSSATILSLPAAYNEKLLDEYDHFFVFYDQGHPWMNHFISEGKKKEKVTVLNASSGRKNGSQPFYEDAYLESDRSMVENMELFCRRVLCLLPTTKKLTLNIPAAVGKDPKRVVIHASGAKEGKRWDLEKFLRLYEHLKKKNFSPIFVFRESEKEEFAPLEGKVSVKFCKDCDELARFLLTARFFIGNDSGVGHLASSLGVPTVTIFRNKRGSKLWRPHFTKGKVVYPPSWILNLSFCRLRDKKWQSFITVNSVLRSFETLAHEQKFSAKP